MTEKIAQDEHVIVRTQEHGSMEGIPTRSNGKVGSPYYCNRY